MNFIDKIERTDKQMELKYCERCGGLFLRLLGVSLVYCEACMAHWAALSTTDALVRSRARRRLRTSEVRRSKIERATQIDAMRRSGATSVAKGVWLC
jgi:ribosomal protein L37AE/L43A